MFNLKIPSCKANSIEKIKVFSEEIANQVVEILGYLGVKNPNPKSKEFLSLADRCEKSPEVYYRFWIAQKRMIQQGYRVGNPVDSCIDGDFNIFTQITYCTQDVYNNKLKVLSLTKYDTALNSYYIFELRKTIYGIYIELGDENANNYIELTKNTKRATFEQTLTQLNKNHPLLVEIAEKTLSITENKPKIIQKKPTNATTEVDTLINSAATIAANILKFQKESDNRRSEIVDSNPINLTNAKTDFLKNISTILLNHRLNPEKFTLKQLEKVPLDEINQNFRDRLRKNIIKHLSNIGY